MKVANAALINSIATVVMAAIAMGVSLRDSRVVAVATGETFEAAVNVAVCCGGMGRSLAGPVT